MKKLYIFLSESKWGALVFTVAGTGFIVLLGLPLIDDDVFYAKQYHEFWDKIIHKILGEKYWGWLQDGQKWMELSPEDRDLQRSRYWELQKRINQLDQERISEQLHREWDSWKKGD